MAKRKDDYKPGERFSAEMEPAFPDEEIACKSCAFARPGLLGYRNSYCRMYEAGKPNEILFEKAPCQYRTEATG